MDFNHSHAKKGVDFLSAISPVSAYRRPRAFDPWIFVTPTQRRVSGFEFLLAISPASACGRLRALDAWIVTTPM